MIRLCLILVRRELSAYFLSLSGYVVLAAVLFLLGLSLVEVLAAFNGETLNTPLTEVFYSTMFFWLILLLAAPIITMRLFAHERATGTFETLLTTPVSDTAVVVAKFAAAGIFYVAMWLPLLLCLAIIGAYAPESAALEWRTVASTFLGITLIGLLYLGLGCLASALTRSQVMAAMLALLFGVALFMLGFLRSSVGDEAQVWAGLANHISLLTHMEDFARGVVDSRWLVFYVSLTGLFLFLTVKVVESRRWR
jgi:ABC-2 type transport system permease protein